MDDEMWVMQPRPPPLPSQTVFSCAIRGTRKGAGLLLKSLHPRNTCFNSFRGDRAMKTILSVATLAGFCTLSAISAPLDTNRIEQITGLKGKWNAEESVFKIYQPRSDVKVSVDQWQMPPFMG